MKQRDIAYMNKAIVYDELNLFTFCLSFVYRFHFRKQYFIDYNPAFKRHFFALVKKMGLLQIHRIDFLGRGISARYLDKAIETGNRLVEDEPSLARPFIRYLDDKRAESLAKKAFIHNLTGAAYKYIVLKEFVFKNKSTFVYYFPTAKNYIMNNVDNIAKNLVVIKWHSPLLSMIRLIKSLAYLFLFVTMPFFLFCMELKKRSITLGREDRQSSPALRGKKIVFFHHPGDLNNHYSGMYKSMYLFNSGIVGIKDCVHSCFTRPLPRSKVDYLGKKGGVIFDLHGQKMHMKPLFKRFFWDYYRSFAPSFYIFSFGAFASFRIVRYIAMLAFNALRLENMFEQIEVKLAYSEIDYGRDASLLTIVANKHNVKTMTTLHGYGSFCYAIRPNSIFDYCLVQGDYCGRLMQPYNPHIDKFYSVGNAELEELEKKNIDLEVEKIPDEIRQKLAKLKNNGFKIISVLAAYYGSFFSGFQTRWPLFDESKLEKAFLHYWMPFFKWAGRQNKLFFIFKAKPGSNQYEHPFLKEALSEIPKSIYYQNDNILMKEAIEASDYTITSPWCESSSFFASWTLGVPGIGYDIIGRTPRDKYNKYFVAKTPGELIENFENILKNGLPEDLSKNIRSNHHVVGAPGDTVSLRIKKLIKEAIEA